MVQIRRLRVLVVGGGISGLSAAVALRLQGHEVEVFEKSSLHAELGNAVYCAPNCTVALKHLNIDPGDIQGVVNRGIKFLDGNCTLLTTRLFTEEERVTWPAEWWLLTRINLHNALKERALELNATGVPVKIHTASPINAIDCETASITLSDGSIVTGDLVVGADGLFSKTRSVVIGHVVPLFSSGMCCYRALIPTADLLAEPDTTIFADGLTLNFTAGDRRLVLYPCAEGKVTNLVAFVPRDEVGEIKKGLAGYDQSANKEQLKSHFRSFAPAALRMLETAPEDSVKVWDLNDMELQPRLIKSKAVLIGDAAHPFLPYLGQGAAQAIEDACALGAVLPLGTHPEDVSRRLALWQMLRIDRVHRIVKDTRHRARGADGKDGPPQTLEEMNAALAFCIHHDAWKDAQEKLEAWMLEEAR